MRKLQSAVYDIKSRPLLNCSRRNYVSASPLVHEKSTSGGQSQNDIPQSLDVLIIGGGMAGASLACGLGQAPLSKHLKIGILDNTFPPPMYPLPPIPDLRVFSINHASIQLFKAVGVWEAMKKARVSPFTEMKVWDSSGPGKISFSHKDINQEELGFIIEHHVIQSAFHEKIKELNNVHLMCPETVESIHFPENPQNMVSIKTKSKSIQARLVVGADGANSIVRKYSKIGCTGYNYDQRALVATVKHHLPNTTAWQRFLPTGPVAMLPLFENYSSIVWSSNAYQVELLQKMDTTQFMKQLVNAFSHEDIASPPWADGGVIKDFAGNFKNILGQVKQTIDILAGTREEGPPIIPTITEITGKRVAFPLRVAHATHYVKPRIALIGDACHTVHPLAGQGINLGFADVIVLINTLLNAIESGYDIGDITILKHYENSRFPSNALMVWGVDGLKKLFDTSFPPLLFARNVGLIITDKVSPIKKLFQDQALGSFVDLGKLSQNCFQ